MVTFKRVFAVFGVAGGLAMAALLLPGKIVDFEKNLPDAHEYIGGIIYDSEAWVGSFDKYPEGLIDIESLGISTNVDAALELEVVEGNRIDGRIWWRGSCSFGGPYSGLLLEGKIKLGGSSADVIIWELVEGQKVEIARGLLEIDERMIRFSQFPERLGLNESTIAKNPPPALLEDWTDVYCS